jgi:hypothetical protein
LEHDPDEVWTEYADPRRDPWRRLVLPVLKRMPTEELAAATWLSERAVKALRNGRATPRSGHHHALARAGATFARGGIRAQGLEPPTGGLAACAAFLSSLRHR